MKVSKRTFKTNIIGYAFISPWLIGFILFVGGPIIASMLLSFCKWDIISGLKGISWIGIENYKNLLGFTKVEGNYIPKDPLFWQSLKVTFFYSISSVPLVLFVSIVAAVLLNQKVKGVKFFRTAFYLPVISASVATALLWRWAFSYEHGLFNSILNVVGIQGPNWLGSTRWALSSFVLMSVWGIGNAMIINLAGLQGIPKQLYEAADIDGAGTVSKFLNVTLPMLSPVIFFNLIIGTIYSFQVFTQALIMTNGQPANATLFYVLYLYRVAFSFYKMGYASAMAWILFVVIFIFTLIHFGLGKKWVHYQGENV